MDLQSFPSKAAHFWLSLWRCTKGCTHKTFALFNFPFIPNVTKCKIGSHCAFKIFLCRLNLQGLIILKSASRSCQNAVCSIPRKLTSWTQRMCEKRDWRIFCAWVWPICVQECTNSRPGWFARKLDYAWTGADGFHLGNIFIFTVSFLYILSIVWVLFSTN